MSPKGPRLVPPKSWTLSSACHSLIVGRWHMAHIARLQLLLGGRQGHRIPGAYAYGTGAAASRALKDKEVLAVLEGAEQVVAVAHLSHFFPGAKPILPDLSSQVGDPFSPHRMESGVGQRP